HEGITLAILENHEHAPRLFLGRSIEKHAFGREFFIDLFNVVAVIGNPNKRADASLLPFWCEKRDSSFCLWDAKLDPALFLVKRLICDNGKSKFFCVEVYRSLL